MRREDNFPAEVSELAQQAVLEEATQKVCSTFDKAVGQLDFESQTLINDYFSGVSVTELSRTRGLSTRDIEEWLKEAKRILFQELRQECNVRQ